MDVFDYLHWRGDLSFELSPLNSVDSLILCQLSYLNFESIIPFSFKEKITLNNAASIFAGEGFEKRRDLGLLINPRTVDLLFECAKTARFANLELCGWRDTYSKKDEEQFSALTFVSSLKKASFAFCAFRGTDDTIIGWKEDCNLAFKEKIKAQCDAASYLEEACLSLKKYPVMCGGHSKGGNLALYAGAKLKKSEQKKLTRIFNFDGPGFLKETLAQSDFSEALKKTYSYFPYESIVGMLFSHGSDYKVINSTAKNVMQHDALTWQTLATDFECQEELSTLSIFFNSTFNEWYCKLDNKKRGELVDVVFGALEATNVKTNSELAENWGKSGIKILKALHSLDKDLRDGALDSAGQFVKLLGSNLGELIKRR